jgi:putative ABC transport system permease protein
MGFWNDLRLAARNLRQSPAFTAVAVLTLALGIGATTAMFSVIHAVLLRPLAFPQPERLVTAAETMRPSGWTGAVSVPDLVDWRAQSRSFAELGGYTTWGGFSLAEGERPERVPGVRISPGLLAALGARPLRGRLLLEEEAVAGRDKVVVLGEAFWRRRFGAAPDIVGRKVHVNGEARTVVGVVPAWLHFPPEEQASQLFVPLAPSAAEKASRGEHWLLSLGRLRDGVTLAQAQTELDGIARRLARQYPDTNEGRGVLLKPLQARLVGGVREPLWVLFGAVALLLAIACVNVANLLLARAVARWREAAVRNALGASRWQLARAFLAEGLVLALLGAVVGLPLGALGLRLLLALAPGGLPRLDEIGLDGRVLLFSLAAAGLTGLLFSLAPIWQVGRLDAGELLKAGTRVSSGRRGRRLRSVLVVAEMALSLLLLAGAALLLRSLWNLSRVNPGLRTHGILAADLALPVAKYDTPPRIASLYGRLLARLSALPGVEAAGMTSLLPIRQWGTNAGLSVEGAPPEPANTDNWVETRSVSPGYFKVLDIGLLRGRLTAESDGAGAPPVAVVNETAMRRFWSRADPLGSRVRVGGDQLWRVIGVVRDVRNAGLARDTRPEVYFPYAQRAETNMTLVVRAAGQPLALAAPLRQEVLAEDRELPLDQVMTMEQVVTASVGAKRFQAVLLAIFAGLALCLAAVGLYGLLGYLVAQRTHEIGVRLALGASGEEIRRLVIGDGLRLVLPGMAIGLGAAAALRRLVANLLFGVGALDMPTLAAVALGLTMVSLLACAAPAWRAAHVDPLRALRDE